VLFPPLFDARPSVTRTGSRDSTNDGNRCLNSAPPTLQQLARKARHCRASCCSAPECPDHRQVAPRSAHSRLSLWGFGHRPRPRSKRPSITCFYVADRGSATRRARTVCGFGAQNQILASSPRPQCKRRGLLRHMLSRSCGGFDTSFCNAWRVPEVRACPFVRSTQTPLAMNCTGAGRRKASQTRRCRAQVLIGTLCGLRQEGFNIRGRPTRDST